MWSFLFRRGFVMCSAVVAPKSAKDFVGEKVDLKGDTGWDRVKKIFTKDEFDYISPELNTIIQTTLFSGFAGACYGGFLHSREALTRFLENNEAAKYVDHFEAKRKLHDFVFVNFAKGALKWSWRLAAFSSLYITSVTLIGAYRGETSLLEYAIAGLLSGSIYRWNYGLNGVIVGGTLGTMLGLFAGVITLYLFRLTGTSFDDVHKWHHEQMMFRERSANRASENMSQAEVELVMAHAETKEVAVEPS